MRSVLRKLEQVARDPVLRRYLGRRLLGRVTAPPMLAAGSHPAYLSVPVSFSAACAPWLRPAAAPAEPDAPLRLDLPGETVVLSQPSQAFGRTFADIETEAALHRFAWLPLNPDVSPDWLWALWHQWCQRHADGWDGLAWEAYTAAERVCILLDYARRHGVPAPQDDFLTVLAGHAPRILARLEYQGESATHNHLANNGRGLYRLGVELGIDEAAQAGLAILEAEADRLLLPSGLLREGSSHYHFLYLRNSADVWFCARRHARPETDRLEALTRRLATPARSLVLPGGMPLIGDISPDSPPDHLAGLWTGQFGQGWTAGLADDEIKSLEGLLGTLPASDPALAAADGFLRLQDGDWALLARAEPGGWPFYPGHAHQDMGSFELHHGTLPVIVDPGRGGYGESGDAAFYRSAAAHNGITLADADPYPANKPYFDDRFRHDVAGPAPEVRLCSQSTTIAFTGYCRFGIGTVSRTLTLDQDRLIITDHVDGKGRHPLVRRFHTPLDIRLESGGVILGQRFRLSATGTTITIEPRTLWTSYGRGRPGHAVVLTQNAALPWSGQTIIEVI